VRGSAGKTLPVSRKNGWANGFGLQDMIGNVWEWTADRTEAHGEFRVLRGGTWNFDPGYCRTAYRFFYASDIRNDIIGFRVCRGSPIDPQRAGSPTAGAQRRPRFSLRPTRRRTILHLRASACGAA
jgi:hypothetical protein